MDTHKQLEEGRFIKKFRLIGNRVKKLIYGHIYLRYILISDTDQTSPSAALLLAELGCMLLDARLQGRTREGKEAGRTRAGVCVSVCAGRMVLKRGKVYRVVGDQGRDVGGRWMIGW